MTAPSKRARTQASNVGQFAPQDWGLLAAISSIWGSSFLLIAFALDGLTPGMITLGRVGLGALTLAILRTTKPEFRQSIDRSDWFRLVTLSIVWVALPFTLFPLAQEHINSALTGLVNGSVPIWAGVISVFFVGRLPRGAQLAGIAIGFLGIVCISLPALSEGSSEAQGVLMVLGATLCYGLAMNLAPPLQQKYGAVTLMSNVLALATLWVLPFGLKDFGQNVWSAQSVVSVTILGVLGTGLAYWAMATLVGRVGPIRASMTTYLIPVVSLILGAIVRGDRVAVMAVVGAGFVIAGALLGARREH